MKEKGARVSVLGREIPLPRSRLLRVAMGCLLVFFGFLGFLPVLGFWMVPLGLLVLSYDFATVRRWRRRLELWWGTKNGRRRRKPNDDEDRPTPDS